MRTVEWGHEGAAAPRPSCPRKGAPRGPTRTPPPPGRRWRRCAAGTAKGSSQLGAQPQVPGELVLVAVLDHPPLQFLPVDQGAVLAVQILDDPVFVVMRDLQMVRLDLRRVDPDA